VDQEGRDASSRFARRWADAAWAGGWHAHALDVLGHAIRLNPDDFKLFRKRGALHLICPDLRDAARGFADLRRACELSGWRPDLAGWAAELLEECGDGARAGQLLALARQAELAAARAGSGERPALDDAGDVREALPACGR
jgi:hypothetical protein